MKSKNSSDLSAYREQRNVVTKLNKQAKKSLFADVIESTKLKSFWKICKPFMTDKESLKQGITLKHDGLFIHDSEEVSELLNSYYNTITESL